MSLTRLDIAKGDIVKLFDSSHKAVYKRSEIDVILSENRDFWRLAQSTGRKKFVSFLKEFGQLAEFQLQFPSRKEIRYVWGDATDLEIVQTLRPDSYFSHFTAMYLNGLTLQIPKTVYINYEQPKKKASENKLVQDRIDYAFRSSCRTSNTIAEFRDKRVCLLNGKNTGKKGVIELHRDKGNSIWVTGVERTLIDIVVRPVYSGGVQAVLEAYRMAATMVSINKLTAMLQEIGYIYPYHQAIGFYLERSGAYTEKQIALIERFKMEYDFYLAHQIKEQEYSKRWKLYYPKGL